MRHEYPVLINQDTLKSYNVKEFGPPNLELAITHMAPTPTRPQGRRQAVFGRPGEYVGGPTRRLATVFQQATEDGTLEDVRMDFAGVITHKDIEDVRYVVRLFEAWQAEAGQQWSYTDPVTVPDPL